MTRLRVTPRYRLAVASRVAAAALGGYAAAALCACLLAVSLPLTPVARAVAGTLTALVVMPFFFMACFWVRSALAAWAWMVGLCLLFGGVAWMMGWRP
jgi:hypothetical protein